MRKSTMFAIVCLFGIFALLGTSAAFAGMVIKGGIDIGGKLDVGGVENDVKESFSVSAEFTKSIMKIVYLGVGVEGQLPRSTEGGTGKFFFVPAYGVGRVQIPLGLISPYATARVGYNFFLGDDAFKAGDKLKGGIHYGIGAGAVFLKFLLAEGSYAIYNGEKGSSDTTYSTFSLKAGVKF